MTDRIFLRLSDRLALGADDLQWILYRSRRENAPSDMTAKSWLARCFVRSHKKHLSRYIRENWPQDDDTAASALKTLPDTFDEWKAAQRTPQAA